jgi:hypothetical protein
MTVPMFKPIPSNYYISKVVISRTRYVSAQMEIKAHIVNCGISLATACDIGEWMGVLVQTGSCG